MLFSRRVRIRIRIRLSVWLVGGYGHVFTLYLPLSLSLSNWPAAHCIVITPSSTRRKKLSDFCIWPHSLSTQSRPTAEQHNGVFFSSFQYNVTAIVRRNLSRRCRRDNGPFSFDVGIAQLRLSVPRLRVRSGRPCEAGHLYDDVDVEPTALYRRRPDHPCATDRRAARPRTEANGTVPCGQTASLW